MSSSQQVLLGPPGPEELLLLWCPIILHALHHGSIPSSGPCLLITCMAAPVEYLLWDDKGSILFLVAYPAIAQILLPHQYLLTVLFDELGRKLT